MDYIFEKGKFTEDELEQAIITLFEQQGYTYVQGEDVHRKYEDILLLDDLRSFIADRYASENLSEAEIQKIINRLNLTPSSPLYNGNREAFLLVNEGFDLVRDDISQVALHVDYIDFDEPSNNIFKVVNQYSVQGERLRRPDLLVFINGIPIAICEFKTAIEEDTTIYDAWEQITIRYKRDIPKLMKYCFLSVISDGANTKLGSIFTPYKFYYSWNKANDQDKVSNGLSSLLTMIEGAFAKDRVTKVLRDYVFYPDDSKKDEAIVCRYPQFFAAQKMLDNIKVHMRPDGDGKGGTYFGATGCGKTYTMLFLSRLIALRDNEAFKNPTIVILEDREDLDTQTSELFVTAKKYLHENDVRSIESREDMEKTLRDKPSGGIYITTIQKFCEKTGLLSDRSNIICISDEAHRTQTGVGAKLKKTDKGVFTTFGFAKYLRDSFPNATYCGFTGTPIDETIAVFGKVVDSYTMKESSDDGITVRIAYEPRLARVSVSDEQAKEIQKYYDQCIAEGSNSEQVEESKRAMSSMTAILGHPDRIKKLAPDMVTHYEALCEEKPEVVQKAMIVCTDRPLAFKVLKAVEAIRPEWFVARKAENESALTKDQLDKLVALPKINLVATQGKNDEKELFDLCGTKEHRKMLDKQFKNNDSNFKIAIVVDMWITGFDVPSLVVMYIDKPLQKHTLIQTISRVNRVFDGKDKGLVVDYIGIKNDMMEAVKKYGGPQENPIDELNISLSIFRNHLALIDELLSNFDSRMFHHGTPIQRLNCLNAAAEYVQTSKDMQTRFMGLSRRLKGAYHICFPSGELTDQETAKAQFYLAIRSIIYKQTRGDAADAEVMNSVVEEMVREAITCTGIENIVDEHKSVDLFSDDFLAELDNVNLPITKFNALLKLLRKAITAYGRTNKVKAIEFDDRLKEVVDAYNSRDKLIFTSEVVSDFVNDLSDQLLKIMKDLQDDKSSFEKLGITYEEKAFYDILVKVRDDHGFPYADEKCLVLAKKIKELVDDKAQFADWSTRDDIKNQLNMDLTVLLYNNGYPPEWDEEVFEKVMEQAENFKKHSV
ncbi:type I site-specific deoxyribonuclease, HsdR family protein [Clostridium botulinum]|uniref:type I restriction endonuclease subunit R n=1 Tax=Clostridium botulinum TaxID=1491 RepID=UPI000947849D|nr:HsdR family type I site-specific deoxyribonuclease [Clostridium botulinum]APR00442.1 type I site-specific deoxyribonuclease, HsdR family protein [Clostridium botulinum]NFM30059.1 type I restriction endonuclease subunit R [Clostridium botulinum]OSA82435.1 type I restriction endonuclease [Clostridium botulinum]